MPRKTILRSKQPNIRVDGNISRADKLIGMERGITRRDFLNGIPLDLNFTREIGFQGHSFTIRIYDRARQPIAVFQADLVGQ